MTLLFVIIQLLFDIGVLVSLSFNRKSINDIVSAFSEIEFSLDLANVPTRGEWNDAAREMLRRIDAHVLQTRLNTDQLREAQRQQEVKCDQHIKEDHTSL